MRKMLWNIFILFFLSQAGRSQTLSIEEAIKTGLQKNYDVLISKNNKEITAAQNNFGNAGMSPELSLNANLNFSSVNSHQEFNNGTVQDRTGANARNLGASANVSWTVFDGMKMFAVKKRLYQNEQLSSIQLKQEMENTVYAIILAYYDIVRIKQLIKALNYNLSVYAERKALAKTRMEIGIDSKVDFLLTQTDENKAKSDLLQLELQLLNARASLNTLLVRAADTDFTTTDTIISSYEPSLEELKKKSEANNTLLLASRQNELIIGQTIKEARSANLPFIRLNGAYNFTNFQSQAGFVFLNRQAGISGGLTAGWLLFSGNKNNRLVKEREINLLSQKYFTDKIKQNIDAIVFINYQSLLTNKKILELETQNLSDAKEVQNISLERYKTGKSNLLETKETQRALEEAQTRYINALYNVKKAETELLKTNGELVK